MNCLSKATHTWTFYTDLLCVNINAFPVELLINFILVGIFAHRGKRGDGSQPTPRSWDNICKYLTKKPADIQPRVLLSPPPNKYLCTPLIECNVCHFEGQKSNYPYNGNCQRYIVYYLSNNMEGQEIYKLNNIINFPLTQLFTIVAMQILEILLLTNFSMGKSFFAFVLCLIYYLFTEQGKSNNSIQKPSEIRLKDDIVVIENINFWSSLCIA